MNNDITFEFYSDTNLSNAFAELQLMSLGVLYSSWNEITIGFEDFMSLEGSIEAIVQENGGVRIL